MTTINVRKRLGQEFRTRVDARVRRIAAPRADVLELQKTVIDLTERLEAQQRKTDELAQRHARDRAAIGSLELLLGKEGRINTRVLTPNDVKTLVSAIDTVTGKQAKAEVAQAYRSLIEIEARAIGRIAGSTPNIIGKLSVAALMAKPDAHVLEIGTLFGVFAAALAREVQRRAGLASMTIVDPMATLQLQSDRPAGADVSGTPAVERVVRHNLGLEPGLENVRLVQGFSHDPVVRAAAATQPFDVIVVDGDHAREGVLKDLQWVEEIAAEGALVILDDYGSKDWPGVEEAAQEHLSGPTRLEMLGTVATSAFLRAR